MERRMRMWPVLASGCLVILLGIAGIGERSATAAESVGRCARCRTSVTRQLDRSNRIAACRNGEAAGKPVRVRRALVRLRRVLSRCARESVCGGELAPELETLRVAVGAATVNICAPTGSLDDPIEDPIGEGGPIDSNAVQGPVGLAPPAVAPDDAASLDEVAAHCESTPDVAPPLMALPDVAELPEWCSETDAYRALVDACGTPRVVVVAAEADPAGATGTVEHPYPTVKEGLAACGRESCHVLVAPGLYAEGTIPLSRCVFLEGGVTLSGGILTRGGARPRIKGTLDGLGGRGGPIVLARLDVEATYGALSPHGDVLVSDSVLRGAYEGSSSPWSTTGPRVCRTHAAGGYVGLDLSWQSSRLWIAGSSVAGCTVGVDVSWGSQDLLVLDSVVYGRWVAVDLNWGSHGAVVRGSRLVSGRMAVNVHLQPDPRGVPRDTFEVTITGNRVTGTLPPNNPALNIVVEDNVQE